MPNFTNTETYHTLEKIFGSKNVKLLENGNVYIAKKAFEDISKKYGNELKEIFKTSQSGESYYASIVDLKSDMKTTVSNSYKGLTVFEYLNVYESKIQATKSEVDNLKEQLEETKKQIEKANDMPKGSIPQKPLSLGSRIVKS